MGEVAPVEKKKILSNAWEMQNDFQPFKDLGA